MDKEVFVEISARIQANEYLISRLFDTIIQMREEIGEIKGRAPGNRQSQIEGFIDSVMKDFETFSLPDVDPAISVRVTALAAAHVQRVLKALP